MSWHRVQAYTESSIHQVQYTPSTAYTKYSIHQVQHTPSTAYTKYSIHQVQHTPSTAYTKYSIHQVQHTQDCLSFLHSHDYGLTPECTSVTTLASCWNTRVFRMALTALMEPRTLWRRITCYPSPRRWVALHTYLHSFAPGIRTISTTSVLQSSQGLQLCCSRLHNAWKCLCLSLADSHILPLRYCYSYISDAALAPYMFSFEILSHIAIQFSLQIHRLPLHLLRHYCILQAWNIQSNLHTL